MNSEVVAPPHPEKAVPHRTFRLPREIGILGALGLMLLVLAIFVPQFRDLQNITNITRNFSFVGIVAMGMTCVILRRCCVLACRLVASFRPSHGYCDLSQSKIASHIKACDSVNQETSRFGKVGGSLAVGPSALSTTVPDVESNAKKEENQFSCSNKSQAEDFFPSW